MRSLGGDDAQLTGISESPLSLEGFAHWLGGRHELMKRVQRARFGEGVVATATGDGDESGGAGPSTGNLDEYEWSGETLRRELQRTLIRGQVSPLDLLERFDKDGSSGLEKKECARRPYTAAAGQPPLLRVVVY